MRLVRVVPWCRRGRNGPLTRTRAADRTSLRSGRRPRSCELLELAADRLERRLDLAAEGGDDGHDHRSDEGDEHAVLDGGRAALAGDVHAGLEVVEQLLDVHGGWFSCGVWWCRWVGCPALQERGASCGNARHLPSPGLVTGSKTGLPT